MSDIDKFWILSCVCFTVIKTFHSIDVTHIKQSTWYVASKGCGADGLEFRENILKDFEILQRKTFWIGEAIYNKTSEWIEILGCYAFTNTHGMTKLTEISSVAECQIKCKFISHIYFGYNEITDICICSENKPTNNANIEVCESMTSLEAYFFYRVYPEKVQSRKGGHCSTLDCRSRKNNLKSKNCFIKQPAATCGNGETTYWKTFYESLDWCKLKNLLLLEPSIYCKIDENANKGIESWTNVFRNVCECQLTIAEGGGQTPLHCLAGELVQLDGQWKLNKTKRDCREGLDWFLCRNKTVETQSTMAASTGYVPFKPTIKKSSSTTSFPVFTSSTKVTKRKTSSLSIALIKDTDMETLPSRSQRTKTYMVKSSLAKERISYIINSTESSGVNNIGEENNHQRDHSEEGSNSKLIGAVIGGLLGTCSVIALLAVLIVCKFRSIGVFKESTIHHKQETSQMEFSKATYQDSINTTDKRSTTTTTSNETYGLAGNTTAVYAVVNKIKTPANINDTYTDAGYGEYDHLHDIQNRRTILQENLYHSHDAPRNEDDQTYDSSDFGKGQSYDGNGVYDHSSSVVEGEYSFLTNKNHDSSISIGIYDKAS